MLELEARSSPGRSNEIPGVLEVVFAHLAEV